MRFQKSEIFVLMLSRNMEFQNKVISNAMGSNCFRYFRKTGSPSQNFFMVKTFQKCNHPDFKFNLGKSSDKIFPLWCNVNFESVFTAIKQKAEKNRPKINITRYGNFLLVNVSS